jgi:peroxiredoxin (alkyl hydroperoxide reductase subunit C)
MKKLTIIILFVCAFSALSWSQNSTNVPLIGDKAPSFTAASTNGQITFPDDYGKKWKILLSHPKDFTPVCSSEILQLADMQKDFDKLNVQIVVLSADNIDQHKEWKSSLECINYKGEGAQKILFPIVADESLKVSKSYGMVHSAASSVKDVRGVFIIDPDNVVQAIYFYPMGVGRNLDEIKRTVIALQTVQANVVVPVNWQPGDDVILTYLTDQEKAEMSKPNPNIYQLAWYMTFKKMQ